MVFNQHPIGIPALVGRPKLPHELWHLSKIAHAPVDSKSDITENDSSTSGTPKQFIISSIYTKEAAVYTYTQK